ALRQDSAWQGAITPYVYRPLDQRFLLYLDSMVDWPRLDVMRQLQQPNYALCVGRAGVVKSGEWDLVFCVNRLCDHNLFYRGSSVNFPLYRYGDRPSHRQRQSNLADPFVECMAESLRLRFVID